jgi:hypothetical protein
MPSQLINFQRYSDSTRVASTSASSYQALSFDYTKINSTTDLVIQATIPVRGGSNGNYSYVEINGVKRRTGITKTYYGGEHMILINQCWSGISSGSLSIKFGWQTNNNTPDQHWSVLHPNNQDDGRNRQTGSNWLIWEVNGVETAVSSTPYFDSDSYWSNVVLLVKNGSSTDFTGRHTISTSGSATTNSTVPPFKSPGSSSSWSLGQNSSSYLSFNNNLSDFSLGATTAWTLEFWSYLTSANNYAHYFTPGGQDAQGTFKEYFDSNSAYRPYMYTGNGLIVGSTTDSDVYQANQWVYHVYQRNGTEMRLWINGYLYAVNNSAGSIPSSTPSYCRSGAWSGEAVSFYLDELRLTTGVARYGSSISIPVQTKTWPTA